MNPISSEGFFWSLLVAAGLGDFLQHGLRGLDCGLDAVDSFSLDLLVDRLEETL